jgi:hypothetical protein
VGALLPDPLRVIRWWVMDPDQIAALLAAAGAILAAMGIRGRKEALDSGRRGTTAGMALARAGAMTARHAGDMTASTGRAASYAVAAGIRVAGATAAHSGGLVVDGAGELSRATGRAGLLLVRGRRSVGSHDANLREYQGDSHPQLRTTEASRVGLRRATAPAPVPAGRGRAMASAVSLASERSSGGKQPRPASPAQAGAVVGKAAAKEEGRPTVKSSRPAKAAGVTPRARPAQNGAKEPGSSAAGRKRR